MVELLPVSTAVMKSVPALSAAWFPGLDPFGASTRARGSRETTQFRDYCSRVSKLIPEPFFVKVGANDGLTADPCSDILLANSNWKGLLIEPVPCCFNRLKINFGDPSRFILEQVAVGTSTGKAKFYYVDPEAAQKLPDLPPWYDQLGSFDRKHISRFLGGSLERFILELDVEVRVLSELLEKHNIQEVHLLQIDTEGYDYEILKTIDLLSVAPLMILLEHKYLSGKQRREMLFFLLKLGYSIRACGGDYFALNEKTAARLR